MKRLRVAVVGAGLVAQAEHLFYLWEERERFEPVAVADPAEAVRDAVGDRYGIARRVATLGELAGEALDAVVCAAPDALHADVVLEALGSGRHVFIEKPLALTPRECDEIVATRDRTGLVVQVGYMKRFDPAFERLLELLPPADALRYVSVEVNDPDFVPFVSHLPMVAGSVSPEVVEAGREQLAARLAEATGREDLPDDARRAYLSYLSSVVHDLNLVHALLQHLGEPLPRPVAGAAFFADGAGASLDLTLAGGGRAHVMHLNLPGVADYTERLTVYGADRILELTFPSPYLRHQPTRLVEKRTAGGIGVDVTEHHVSYEEAFRSELRAFHAAVAEGAPVRNPPEEAALDVRVLAEAHRLASRGAA